MCQFCYNFFEAHLKSGDGTVGRTTSTLEDIPSPDLTERRVSTGDALAFDSARDTQGRFSDGSYLNKSEQ